MKGRPSHPSFNLTKIKLFILYLLFYFLLLQTGYAQTPSDGLVAYWTFDEGSGTTAQDSSGYENTGILVNGPSWVTGRVGNSLSFDGKNDYVEINDNHNLDLTGGGFTLSAWIYPESYGEDLNGRIIDHGGGSNGDGGWSLLLNNYQNGHNLRQSIKDGNSRDSIYSDIGSISLNTWQHVAVTLEFGTITFYVNGQIKGQASGVPTPTDRDAPVRIGMRATDFFRAFTGVIDEVRIYDRALTLQDIINLYNQVPPLSDIDPPIISNGHPSGVLPSGTTFETLSVTTDEAATCKYTIFPDIPYSQMQDTFLNTGGTTHTNPIPSLEDDQSFTYYIKCRDLSGNSNPDDFTVSFSIYRDIYHISPMGSDSNPGTNVLPFATIQHALNSVVWNASYDVLIKVAEGTYYENINIVCCSSSQSVGNNLLIQAGWKSDFSERDENPSNTVIDGGGKQRVIKINVPTLNLTIEGFTIRNGYDSVGGGGIYVFPFYHGNITLSLINNIIAQNSSGSYGGGVYVFSKKQAATALTFTKNVIVNNSANHYCGGICVNAEDSASTTLTFTNNVVKDNHAGYHSGGIYLRSYSGATITSTFTNNTITDNSAAYFGAGVYAYSESDATLTADFTNNIITGNRVDYFGGGVYMHSVYRATFISNFTNNIITKNSASLHGGGIYALSALGATKTSSYTNNIITGNIAGYDGGGVFNWGTTASTFTNNTITGNSAAYLGGGLRMTGGLRLTDGPIMIIAKEDTWKYDIENTGTTWMDPGYDDSLWPTGSGIFGTEENLNITTDISNTNLSMFFRKTFTIGDPTEVTALTLNSLFDDGMAVYINGTQVYSENVSGDPPPYNGGVSSQHEAEHYEAKDLTGVIGLATLRNLLEAGTNNVIAVGIYNNLPASSDIVWDGKLIISHKEDTWKYNIENTGTTWMDPGYDDSLWSTGSGIFGTEENLTITTDISNTYLSMFFRKTFTIGDPTKVTALTLNSLFDDGMAVYINGTQVYSENVSGDPPPYDGGVSSQHEAEHYEAKDLTSVIGLATLRNLLEAGTNNVIAVGIYNNFPASSDIVWDGIISLSVTDIYNNIIWGNTSNSCGDLSIHNDFNGTIRAYNNDFDPAKVCATFTEEGNNINVDPLFVAWIEGDYHLTNESECIDAGDNTVPSLPAIDYEGDPRLAGAVDIGADEHDLSSVEKIYYCDYDHDGYIDSIPGNICYSAGCELLYCETVPGTDCNDKDFYEHPNQTWYKDSDNDEYSDGTLPLVSCIRPSGYRTDMEITATSGDCDDRPNGEDAIPGTADDGANINPGAPEIWYDGIDQDCDGWNDYDKDMDTCVHENWNNKAGGTSTCIDDCDDIKPVINPQTNWYPDSDGDGYGNQTIYLVQCNQPAGYVMDNPDCDDNDANIYTGGPEVRIVDAPTSYYWMYELQTAYDDALDWETIQIKAETFTDNFSINQGKTVTIKGGYDCSYSDITGVTTVSGNMVVTDGSVTVENFEIQLLLDYNDY